MVESMVKVPQGVLRRKFRCPSNSSSYVPPAKHSTMPDDLGNWNVCLVNAAGGYGKTSLLAYWYEQFAMAENHVVLWVSLDESDRNEIVFLKSLAYLFCKIDTAFSALIEVEDLDSKTLLIDICNLLDEKCDSQKRYCLFLDECEVASSDSFDETVLYINRNTDDNFKIIMSATYFSARLADLLLSTSVMELTTRDLRPSTDDILAYASALMPSVPRSEIEEMHESFGEWPLVYSFAALANSRPAAEGGLEATVDGYCARHFTTTVFNKVDDEIREFLLDTAILDVLNVDACDAVRVKTDSRTNLAWLQSRSCYCWYEEKQGGYIYEPMFRKFLLAELSRIDHGRIGRLAANASAWYAKQGLRAEQAKYLAISSDPYYLTSSVEKSSDLSLGNNPQDLTKQLLSYPAESFEEKPELIWVAIWSFIAAGAAREAEEWMELPSVSNDESVQTSCAYARAICYALNGDSQTSLEVIQNILNAEGSKLPTPFQCLLIHMEGENFERLGNPKQGRELYSKALSLAERTGNFYSTFDLYLLAHQHFLLGNFESARLFTLRGIRECIEGSSLYGEFCGILGAIATERGELDEADPYIRQALEFTTPQSNIDMYVDVHVHAACFQHALGVQSEGMQLLTDMLRSIDGKLVPRNLQISAHAARVSIALETGEVSAMRESEAVLDAFVDNSDVLRVIQALVAKTKIYINDGNLDEAAKTLERLRKLNIVATSRYYAVSISILEAVHAAASGQVATALPLMIGAIEQAIRGGYVMVFAEGGPITRALLMQIAAKQRSTAAIRTHAKKTLRLLGHGETELDPMPVDDIQSLSLLTERELEVLKMLNQGMTRFEIADILVLSQNTVKSHLKNIYAKLGAHSREEVFSICQSAGIGKEG